MSSHLNIEAEIKDIKQHVIEISKSLDELLYEREMVSIMKLEEKTLPEFFKDEEDIYKITDLKVRY